MPTAPTVELCDDLVAAISTAWMPTAPNSVERDYLPRYGDGENGSIVLTEGRKVVLVPATYDSRYETRGQDQYTHTISVFTIERYTPDDGLPTKAWVDERVNFVHQFIVQGLDFNRNGPPSWNTGLGTLSMDVLLFDEPKLATRGHLFVSQVDIVFTESRDA